MSRINDNRRNDRRDGSSPLPTGLRGLARDAGNLYVDYTDHGRDNRIRPRDESVDFRDLGHFFRQGIFEDSSGRRYQVLLNGEGSDRGSRATRDSNNNHQLRGHHLPGDSTGTAQDSRNTSSSSSRSRPPSSRSLSRPPSHNLSRLSNFDVGDAARRSMVRTWENLFETLMPSPISSRSSSTRSRGSESPSLEAEVEYDFSRLGETMGPTPQSQLFALLEGDELPDNSTAMSTRGRPLLYTLARFLPPNIEPAGYYTSSTTRELQLTSVIRRFFPDGSPPNRSLVLVGEPDPNNGNEPRVSIFDDHGASELSGERVTPIFANANGGQGGLTEEQIRNLATLINRTGIIPQILRENIENLVRPLFQTDRASEGTIGGLRTRPIAKEDLDEEGRATCSICLDEKQIGQEVTVLPCNHFFDKQCVEEWLRQHGTCPMCRRSFERTPL